MEENINTSKAGQGLGIAGFVLGAVALTICWIPCIGMWAFFPGIVGVILSAVALAQATKGGNKQKGLIIAAIILSIIGTAASVYQYFAIKKAANEFTNDLEDFGNDWKNAIEELDKDSGFFNQLADEMDELKEQLDSTALSLDSTTSYFNSENWDSLIDAGKFDEILNDYEEMVQAYVDFVEKAEKGDLSAITSYMNIATKLSILTMKMAAIMPKLSDEQIERFNQIDEKYKKYLKE
ncbi:MAG: hypothetical protein Kow0068_24430 [Marinilabiliales bacterium]